VSATDDVARMLTLVPWLLERPGADLEETAEAFGVSARTIRRDLSHLDFCGLPGLGGGDLFEVDLVGDRIVVRMADELRRPLRLTPREALRLVLTVDAVAEVLADELPALRSAVDKVRAATGIAEAVADVLEPEATRWTGPIREALRRGVRLRFDYQGRGDDRPQTREVDPWALHVLRGVWYLQGHDLGASDRRTFRLDRIAALEATDVPVQHAAPRELPPPRYAPGPDDLSAVLRVRPGARWLLDAVDPDEVEELSDGGARVRMRTDAPRWLARLVLMAAGQAEVESPGALRDEIVRMAEEARAQYDGAD
jgi:proteasome accessory factor C